MNLYRRTWAEIDLKAIKHNVREIKGTLPADTKIFAVVKANGYGHGAVQVAKAALEAGADYLAVALLEEALELRKSGITEPILVFGSVDPEAAKVAVKKEITLSVFHKEWLERVKDFQLEEKVKIHLKLDSGMGRLGIRTAQEVEQFLEVLSSNPNVALTGVYTHFATADDLKFDIFSKQKDTFKQLLKEVQSQYSKNICIHWSNSAATMREPNNTFNAVRLGVAMYGLHPSTSIRESTSLLLKPAFSLHSELTHVKRVKKGRPISYSASYITKDDEWIGTVPIGYADGFRRSLQGTDVLINGRRCEIVGRICMDQLMIRLDQYYHIGTKVTLIGVQGKEEITADEVANKIGTINYEIPCMITSRVPRLLKEDL